ncbi:MAG: hypothetical protein RKO25_12590 [Candidatus Contendobacter sp.]|nr:hypothetical protein [Candidatus Contendobacter sp.]
MQGGKLASAVFDVGSILFAEPVAIDPSNGVRPAQPRGGLKS